MSKFIDSIQSRMTGKRVLDPIIPLLSVQEDYNRIVYSAKVEYAIEVRYGSRVVCSSEELSAAKESIVRSLREEIFGEFRKKAMQVQRVTYSGSRQDIQKAVDELVREVLG